MAAVTRTKGRPVTPVGYEVNDKGVCAADWTTGDELINSAAGWVLAPAGALEAHGIALNPAKIGDRGCDIGLQGEMDGFSGLVPGAALYPSATVAGGLDTTAVAGATIRVRAAATTRIRYSYV